jgi:hypothetical protein
MTRCRSLAVLLMTEKGETLAQGPSKYLWVTKGLWRANRA